MMGSFSSFLVPDCAHRGGGGSACPNVGRGARSSHLHFVQHIFHTFCHLIPIGRRWPGLPVRARDGDGSATAALRQLDLCCFPAATGRQLIVCVGGVGGCPASLRDDRSGRPSRSGGRPCAATEPGADRHHPGVNKCGVFTLFMGLCWQSVPILRVPGVGGQSQGQAHILRDSYLPASSRPPLTTSDMFNKTLPQLLHTCISPLPPSAPCDSFPMATHDIFHTYVRPFL